MSKGHLPGAHQRAQATRTWRRSLSNHATATGQSQPAVTSWQSRSRRGSLNSPFVLAADDQR
jgi:hypothetical protein